MDEGINNGKILVTQGNTSVLMESGPKKVQDNKLEWVIGGGALLVAGLNHFWILKESTLFCLLLVVFAPVLSGLLTRINKFKWGDWEAEFSAKVAEHVKGEIKHDVDVFKDDTDQTVKRLREEIGENVNIVKREANVAMLLAKNPLVARQSTIGMSMDRETELKTAGVSPKPDSGLSLNFDDPQKGRWSGKPINNGRRLEAVISPIPNDSELHRVTLEVVSIDEEKPLEGTVRFHLHPTFTRPIQTKKVHDGKAVLELIAWGCFTVGAEADGGSTLLELDLAGVRGGNSDFYSR